MSGFTHSDDDIGLPPGDEQTDAYEATRFVRGAAKGGSPWIWFSCVDADRDRIEMLAHLFEIEPGSVTATRAWLHFTGMDVILEGTGMRQVIYRMFLGRCTSVHEYREGQTLAKPNDPVVRHISFKTPPPPKPEPKSDKKQPKHEPETKAKEGAKIN